MLMRIRKSLRSQKGFTLVELLAVIAILGILAALAIPRFTNATVMANTSKVASDLRTIDSAITMYIAQERRNPTNINTLVNAGQLASAPVAPRSGAQLYVATSTTGNGDLTTLSGNASYGIATVGTTLRAVVNGGGLTNVTAEYVHYRP